MASVGGVAAPHVDPAVPGTVAVAVQVQVVAVVPAGVGAGMKAAIAWSGTYAVGRAAVVFYERGRIPSVADIRDYEQEGQRIGRPDVDALAQNGAPAESGNEPGDTDSDD